MNLEVLNISGKKSSKKVTLDKSVFGVEPNDHAIYLSVKQYLAAQRQGTHKTKEVSELSGSTRKIKRQKGTGSARAGSIKNPMFVGGARTFGPRPRSYDIKINKKVSALARKSALSYKAKDNNIIVVEDFKMKEPKTKEMQSILKNLKLEGNKSLIVVEKLDNNFFLSSRNLKNLTVKSVDSISTYDIMNSNKVVLAEGSIKKLESILNK